MTASTDDLSEQGLQRCEACGEAAPVDAKWCEACGHDLGSTPKPTCVACGAAEVDDLGYCLSCGHRQPTERDRVEVTAGSAAAVSDRGKRHRHNEDAVAVAVTDTGSVVLVVCDGVSTTAESSEASLKAATAACESIEASLPTGESSEAALSTAIGLAQEAASSVAAMSEDTDDGGAPSTTLVAVVVEPLSDGVRLSTGWVGDSRAYWITDGENQKLTGQDHEVDGSLSRWLGADSADPRPDIRSVEVAGPGMVVVCSDGLWRYASEPDDLAQHCRPKLAVATPPTSSPTMDVARHLVDFANESGGHDNISVALWASEGFGQSADLGDDEDGGGETNKADGGDEIYNADGGGETNTNADEVQTEEMQ